MAAGEVRVGASLSLAGRYALQGREAEAGIRLWAANANACGGIALGRVALPVRLVVSDDSGGVRGLSANLARLLDEEGVQVLFGPYGSDLALAAVRLAAARGRVLWNHAGASDDVPAAAPQAVVSGIAPASAYFADLPPTLRRDDPGLDRLAILHSARGTFGRHVAAGAAAAARGAGWREVAVFPFVPPLEGRPDVLDALRAWRPQAAICAGRFEDDVWLAGRREALGTSLRALAAVGAGLAAFGAAAGRAAEGIIGPSHWEPPASGVPGPRPEAGAFAAAFARLHGRPPEYPAALAYAMGEVLAACAARAGSLEGGALRRAAASLEMTTLAGPFRLDPATGVQVGYRPLLVQWRRGAKGVLGTEGRAGGPPPGG